MPLRKPQSPKTCSECGKRGACINSRAEGNAIKRRYKCACGHRWNTYECHEKDVA
jgi:transcriptional regulator NrdR family protein